MEFDHNWEPGENDSPARRWARRIVFVVGLVVLVWVAAIVSGGDARGEDKGQIPQTSSTYRPENPLKPASKWNPDQLRLTADSVDAGWDRTDDSERSDLCALMKTGYHERAVRSLSNDGGVDLYFAAQLLEVKCSRSS